MTPNASWNTSGEQIATMTEAVIAEDQRYVYTALGVPNAATVNQ